jgi:hypothetical protein
MEYTIVGIMTIGFLILIGNYLLTLKEKKLARDNDE